jgi:CubicO group peptidase (beta-lactamase class C family)/predicted aspartyl protease
MDRSVLRWPLCLSVIAAIGAGLEASPRPVDPPRRTSAIARTEVPLSRLRGLPVIPVSVNGAGPFRFIVDWGANVLSISPKIARELHLPESGKGPQGNPNVSVAELRIGDDAFSGMTALVDPFFDTIDADGVVGLNAYRGLVATIDYPGSRFRLERSELPGADGKTILDYRAEGQEEFVVSVEVAGRNVSAVLDTGASRGLLLPAAAEKDFAYREPMAESSGIATGPQAGTYHPREGVLSGTLKIGQFEFPDPAVTLNESPSFLIGAAVLEKFEISLDQKNRRVRLLRRDPSPVPAPNPGPRPPDITAHATAADKGEARFPATALGRRVRTYFDAFNSGDAARMKAFYEENFTAESLRQRPPEARLRVFAEMRGVNRSFRVDRVVEQSDGSIMVLAENARGEWREMTFADEKDAEHHLAGMRVEDAEPPAGSAAPPPPPPEPKRSDAEAAAAAEALASRLAAEGTFSGVILLARNGRPFFEKAYGLANREFNAPCTLETKFNIGSMNKFLTTIAIGQLAASGKLSLDDTIRKWLPAYPNAYADRVTVGELVRMRSGMGDMFGPKALATPPLQVRALEDYLPWFQDDPLRFEPGTKEGYSNAGFIVLGLIVQKASGEDYYDYVRAHVLAPAGMTNTDSWAVDEVVPGRAEGYTREGPPAPGGEPVIRRAVFNNPGRGSSAGGGYSTAGDLLKLDQALRAGKLLPPEWAAWAASRLERPSPPGPGGKPALAGGYGFAGGSPGTNAVMSMNFDSGTTVIVLSNLDPPAAESVAKEIRGWVPR